MNKSVRHPAGQAREAASGVSHNEWAPPAARFTWELICISLLGAALVGLMASFLIAVAHGRDPGLALNLITFGVALLCLKLVPRLANKYRERRKRVFSFAAEVLATDPRPRVLYLRPFKDDESISRAVGLASVEQEMCMVLAEIGPLLIYGGPWEPTDPGAPRVAVAPGESWQDEVGEQMSKARLVVMRIGDTPGFLWEVEEASRRVEPERLVFWVPQGKSGYEKFRREAQRWLPCRLPEYEAGRWPRFTDRGGVLYFEKDWTPHLQWFKTAWLRQTFWDLFAATLKSALRPVYEQLDIVWRKPPVQPIQVLYMLALILLSALVVYCTCVMLYSLGQLLWWFLRRS